MDHSINNHLSDFEIIDIKYDLYINDQLIVSDSIEKVNEMCQLIIGAICKSNSFTEFKIENINQKDKIVYFYKNFWLFNYNIMSIKIKIE